MPRFRGPRAKGQRLLLCPAFTLKSWRWGRAAARLETNANTESYLCGRTWFFKKKTPGRRHRSASDPKHQWELTRQAPWAQCTLTLVSFKPLAEDPISSPHPSLPLQFNFSLLFLLPRRHTKTSCESNKPLIDHKALSGDRLGLLKMSGVLPRAQSLPPTSPAPGLQRRG